MFSSLTDSFKNAINKIRFQDDEKALKKAIDELKKALLKADVHYKIVKELLSDVELDTKNAGIGKENFLDSLKKRLTDILSAAGHYGFVYANRPPTVVLLAGLQGSGKTTTTGKLAYYLKTKQKRVLVAACDLQRVAAVEQLRQVTSSIEVDLFTLPGVTNPVEVSKRALERAKEGDYDVLLVDSAGRLAIDSELMSELKEIKKSIEPHEVFYVADSLSGQDGVRSALTFHQEIELSGVILSKYDGDSKGGIALSVAKQVGVPLRFIGSGEKMPDLEVFIPERIVNRLIGAGDIESLAEKTSDIISDKDAKKLTKKLKKGEFNFNDFLEQMENIKKLGNLQSVISMIPGLGNMAKSLKDVDLENSSELKQIKAFVSSMTPKERENPSILNGSRKKRIASGAGYDVMELNRVIKKFTSAQKMAKKFSGKKGMNDLLQSLGGAKTNPALMK